MTAVKNGWALVDKSTGEVIRQYAGLHVRQLAVPSADGKNYSWHEPPYDQEGRKIVERWEDNAVPENHKVVGVDVTYDGVRLVVSNTTVPVTAEERAAREKEIAREELAHLDLTMIRAVEDLVARTDALAVRMAVLPGAPPDPGVPQVVRDRIVAREALRTKLR